MIKKILDTQFKYNQIMLSTKNQIVGKAIQYFYDIAKKTFPIKKTTQYYCDIIIEKKYSSRLVWQNACVVQINNYIL